MRSTETPDNGTTGSHADAAGSEISSHSSEWQAMYNLLFTSGISHLVFFRLQLTETTESKAADKGKYHM